MCIYIYIYYLHLPHPVTTWHFFSWRTKERYVRKALDRVGGSHISVPSFSCRVAVSWLCQCQVYGSGSIQGSFAKYSTKSSTLGLQLLHAWICMTNIWMKSCHGWTHPRWMLLLLPAVHWNANSTSRPNFSSLVQHYSNRVGFFLA